MPSTAGTPRRSERVSVPAVLFCGTYARGLRRQAQSSGQGKCELTDKSIPQETASVQVSSVADIEDPYDLLGEFSANGAGYTATSAAGTQEEDAVAAPPDPDAEAQANVFDTWAPVSVAEYASQPLPERRYLVHGLLPIHGVSVFHGMPGSLKTMFVLDGASCVASGCEWLPQVGTGGGHTFSTTRVPVLWLNFDMADEDIHERAAAVYRTRPLPDGAVFDVVSLPTPWLNLSNANFAQQLAEWVRLRGYGLVVIDNFSNVKGAAKLIDESIADVMLNIRRLSKLAGCAVWVIHHETKNVAGKSAFERMYGGVHIAASVEAAFSISRSGDTVTLAASKQRGHMVTTAFCALFAYSQNEDSTLDTFKFFAAAAPDVLQEEDSSAGAAPLQHELLRVLLSSPLSYKSVDDLVTALGDEYSPNSVRNAVTKMHGKGLVMRKMVGKVAMYCAAPADMQKAGVKNWTQYEAKSE